MIERVNYNGAMLPSSKPLFTGSNRAFRYGDGLFESIRMLDGKLPFLDLHLKRLRAGMAILYMEQPEWISMGFFRKEIKKVTGTVLNARIRLTVFRTEGGFYLPETNEPCFFIEATELDSPVFEVNPEGLCIAFADKVFRPSSLSNLKTNNGLPYILAKLEAKRRRVDDLILFNEKDQIIEATSSNIFVVRGKQIKTPPLSTGCLDGVMRQILIKNQKKIGLNIIESSIKTQSLKKADEIWLTSATQGIRWISGLHDETFDHKLARQAILNLNDLIGE